MLSRVGLIGLALALIVTACGSGPSPEALARDALPTTTTTTEPPPEGVFLVEIERGAFRPSNLELDLNEFWIVEWVNLDDVEYVVEGRRGEFESPPLAQGERFQLDIREFETGIMRYFTFRGQQRIPGSIDTRGQ